MAASYKVTKSQTTLIRLESFYATGAALAGAAVILFERYEQKDKSGSGDPAFLQGNAQIKRKINSHKLVRYLLQA
jgi:hypothetical protein